MGQEGTYKMLVQIQIRGQIQDGFFSLSLTLVFLYFCWFSQRTIPGLKRKNITHVKDLMILNVVSCRNCWALKECALLALLGDIMHSLAVYPNHYNRMPSLYCQNVLTTMVLKLNCPKQQWVTNTHWHTHTHQILGLVGLNNIHVLSRASVSVWEKSMNSRSEFKSLIGY